MTPTNRLFGNISTIYMAIQEKHNFLATAHLSFSYGESPKYLSTANRPIISPLEIVLLFD
jgi:hypothetical protein